MYPHAKGETTGPRRDPPPRVALAGHCTSVNPDRSLRQVNSLDAFSPVTFLEIDLNAIERNEAEQFAAILIGENRVVFFPASIPTSPTIRSMGSPVCSNSWALVSESWRAMCSFGTVRTASAFRQPVREELYGEESSSSACDGDSG